MDRTSPVDYGYGGNEVSMHPGDAFDNFMLNDPWQTPTFNEFVNDPVIAQSSVPESSAQSHSQSLNVDPALLRNTSSAHHQILKTPPTHAGSVHAAPALGFRASAASLDAIKAFGDLDTPRPGAFPEFSLPETLGELDEATRSWDPRLTEGLTASPEQRYVLPDMSAFFHATGDGEYAADGAQQVRRSPYVALPSFEQTIDDYEVEDAMGLPNVQPEFGLGIFNTDNANLDGLNFDDPEFQQALDSISPTGESLLAPPENVIQPHPRAMNTEIVDAMQQTYPAPAAYMGAYHQQPQPIRLRPVGEYALPVAATNIAFPAVAPQTSIYSSDKVIRPPKLTDAAKKSRARPLQPAPGGFKKEQAKLSSEKNWVRVNERLGANNRGGKLNQYNPNDYYNKVPPPPAWSADGIMFEYNGDGELLEACYSAQELDAYLRFHDGVRSGQDRGKLRVWIQKTPADCARRYANPSSSECKFKECPLRQLGKHATIWQGHLRVAFDENYDMHGRSGQANDNGRLDPFANAGYCHLYCFERFLDLPSLLAAGVTVKLDSRVIDTEPNGNYPCKLDPNDPQDGRFNAAIRYMAQTHRGKLVRFPKQYPPHSGGGGAKPHQDTLNGVMQRTYVDSWAGPKMRTMRERGGATGLLHTLGDLEKFCAAKWPEKWASLREGVDPRKAKEKPKYERGTKGYGSGKGQRGSRGGQERKRKRAAKYETDSEEEEEGQESDKSTSGLESELDFGGDLDSGDERPARRARKGKSSTRPNKRFRHTGGPSQMHDEKTAKLATSVLGRGKQAGQGDEQSDSDGESLFSAHTPRRSARKTHRQATYNEASEDDDL